MPWVVLLCFFFFRYVWLSSTACTARDTSQGCRWAVYTFYINTSVWYFFLIPLLECFREMQRLHREMSNDVAVNEEISWCDSKEWGICVINYIYIIIMFNYSTNIRPRNFLYMSQVRWKLFQSKFSNKIIRLHFFLSFIVTQLVCTEVFFIQMMVARLMLLLH